MVLSITRGPAKPMSALGSAMFTSPEEGEARGNATCRRVKQHTDEREARLAQALTRGDPSWPSA